MAIPFLLGAVLTVWAAADVIRNWGYGAFGKKGPWAGIRNENTLVYWEDWRRMTIEGNRLIDGFEIYVVTIVAWDDSDGELVSESERQKILGNIQSSLKSKGARAVLN